MKRKMILIYILIFLLVCIGILIVRSPIFQKSTNINVSSGNEISVIKGSYQRIISLAPSITEVLFILGMGDRVVGVTNFCDYPVEAKTKEKVGGYYDTSYETILSLEPDLVIMLPEHETQRKYLEALGIGILVVDQRDTQGIIKSIMTIGRVCGKEIRARNVVSDINTRIDHIKVKTLDLSRPKILICVGRTMGSGTLEDIFICGRKGFYNEIITLAGGINAYEGNKIRYPTITGEGITRLNPDIIIEIIPDLQERGLDKGTLKKKWELLPGVDAVKNNCVFIFGQDYVATPGPRFILILELMARAIHPGINWE